jgi:hypothetical protein
MAKAANRPLMADLVRIIAQPRGVVNNWPTRMSNTGNGTTEKRRIQQISGAQPQHCQQAKIPQTPPARGRTSSIWPSDRGASVDRRRLFLHRPMASSRPTTKKKPTGRESSDWQDQPRSIRQLRPPTAALRRYRRSGWLSDFGADQPSQPPASRERQPARKAVGGAVAGLACGEWFKHDDPLSAARFCSGHIGRSRDAFGLRLKRHGDKMPVRANHKCQCSQGQLQPKAGGTGHLAPLAPLADSPST